MFVSSHSLIPRSLLPTLVSDPLVNCVLEFWNIEQIQENPRVQISKNLSGFCGRQLAAHPPSAALRIKRKSPVEIKIFNTHQSERKFREKCDITLTGKSQVLSFELIFVEPKTFSGKRPGYFLVPLG